MKRKMSKPLAQRLTALLLTGALLVPTAWSAQAAAPITADTNAPTIRVVSTLVEGGKYLELGLNIDSKGDGEEGKENSFQSAAVLLTYDPAKLTPVTWGEPAGEIATAAIAVEQAGSAGARSKVLPAKGADELSGRLAEAVTVGGQGYLFLSAEAARTMALHQALPADAGVQGPPTANGVPVLRIAEAKTPAAQATVVRFRVNEKTPATETDPAVLYGLEELVSSVDVATDTAVMASFPLMPGSAATYLADNTVVSVTGAATTPRLQLVWIQKGQTVNSGSGGSTEGIVAITAFDWDGTMLGSFIFATDVDPDRQLENAQAALDAFVAQDDVKAKLVSHAGYDFLTWVKDEDDVPSSYGIRALSLDNSKTEVFELNSENQIDFSKIKQSATVKAAYTTNEDCATGEGMNVAAATNARRYTTSIASYDRFGTGNSFSINIKVERKNVPRATQSALRVRMNIDGVDVYSQYLLSGADIEIVEVAPFAQSNTSGVLKGVSLVEWTVIDIYKAPNWVGAAARTTVTDCRSTAAFTIKAVGTANNIAVWNENTYPLYGVVAGINATLEGFHVLKEDNPSLVPDNSNMAGITLPVLRSIGIPTGALATMRNNLYNKWLENGMQALDYQTLYETASGVPFPAGA